MRSIFTFLCMLLAVASGSPTLAQALPDRPVRIIIGFPPGGGIDSIARMLAPDISRMLERPVIVENKPGANGVIATDTVAKAAPDGTSIIFGTMGSLALNPMFYSSLPYDMNRDLAPLTQVASVSFMLLSNPKFPPTTVGELVSYARANPGKVNFSSSGNGSTPHLAGALLDSMADIETVHVPYKGSSPMITDLIGGQVQFSFDSVATSKSQVDSGKLHALAVTGPKRIDLLPNVPTVAETIPGYEVVNWYGMMVPAKTPSAIVQKLQQAVAGALKNPETAKQIKAMGIDPVGSTPKQFGAFLKSEMEKWAKVIKDANIQIN